MRHLIVSPGARRLGVGRALLEALRPHRRPQTEAMGVVVEGDAALTALLRSHGARVADEIAHYAGPL